MAINIPDLSVRDTRARGQMSFADALRIQANKISEICPIATRRSKLANTAQRILAAETFRFDLARRLLEKERHLDLALGLHLMRAKLR